jgi:Uncharacterized conserved protein
MKKMWLSIGLVSLLAVPAFAQDKEADRVENSGKVMKEILNAPDSIPQSVLDKADCVVVLPSVLKFAFIFGGSYGRGVMTCRGGKTFHGRWGAPTMIALGGGSAGLQIGGNATDFVLLLMSPRSATSILKSKVKLGGDATPPLVRLAEPPLRKLMSPYVPKFFPTREPVGSSRVSRSRVPLSGVTTVRTRTSMARM